MGSEPEDDEAAQEEGSETHESDPDADLYEEVDIADIKQYKPQDDDDIGDDEMDEMQRKSMSTSHLDRLRCELSCIVCCFKVAGLCLSSGTYRAQLHFKEVASEVLAKELGKGWLRSLRRSLVELDDMRTRMLSYDDILYTIETSRVANQADLFESLREVAQGDDEVNYAAFLRHCACKASFNVFDADADGRITKEDVMRSPLLHKITKDAGVIDKVVKALDEDGDGFIGFKDFCTMMKVRSKPFVDWPQFNAAVGVVIIVNALLIGMEIDSFDGESRAIGDRIVWYALENIFCLLFLFELLGRLYFHHMAYFYSDGVPHFMNIMDFFLVAMSILDTWILTPLAGGSSLRVLMALRVCRIARLVRLIRLINMFKELWLIVHGLIQSMRTLGWVCVLLVVTAYTFGIFATQQIGQKNDIYNSYYLDSGGWDHEVYFGTVYKSMLTLFQVATLSHWSEGVVRHVMRKQPEMVFFFLFFIIFVTFGLLNIVVGVIVENVLQTAKINEAKKKKKQEMDKQRIMNHLRQFFEMADADNSGTLQVDEVIDAIQDHDIANKLKLIDFPVDDPNEIFMLLDVDGSGCLSIDEFIGGCMRLKGQAKSKDLLQVRVAVETLGKHLSFLENVLELGDERLMLLDSRTQNMIRQAEEVFLDARELKKRARTDGGTEEHDFLPGAVP